MSLLKEPPLLDLAEKMSSLPPKNKEIFLGKLRKCADLLKNEKTGDILTASPDVIKYQLELIASLYYQLSGKKYHAYLCAEYTNNPEIYKEKALQDVIHRGIYAYCYASDEVKSSFEKQVKKTLFSPSLNKKNISNHNFR